MAENTDRIRAVVEVAFKLLFAMTFLFGIALSILSACEVRIVVANRNALGALAIIGIGVTFASAALLGYLNKGPMIGIYFGEISAERHPWLYALICLIILAFGSAIAAVGIYVLFLTQ